jgi:hypothetical protein
MHPHHVIICSSECPQGLMCHFQVLKTGMDEASIVSTSSMEDVDQGLSRTTIGMKVYEGTTM